MEQFPDVNWDSLNRCRRAFHVLGWVFAAVTGMAAFYTFFEAMPVVALAILLGGSFLTAFSWLVAVLLPFHMHTIQALWNSAETIQHWNSQQEDAGNPGQGNAAAACLPKDPSSLQELTLDQAAALAHESFIHLDGLTTLSPEAAKKLIEPSRIETPVLDFRSLSLNGLKAMTPDLAAELATYKGLLSLDSLAELAPDSAGLLASAPFGLSLNGLTNITPEVAKALSPCDSLDLNGVRHLTEDAATALSQPHGCIQLNGLVSLTPEIAASLARRFHKICLGGLVELTSEVAEALAENPGTLELGIERGLTPAAAEKLAKHTGYLFLRLPMISLAVAEALAQHCGTGLNIGGLTVIPDDVADALAKHGNGRIVF